jgi:hypothetical protein
MSRFIAFGIGVLLSLSLSAQTEGPTFFGGEIDYAALEDLETFIRERYERLDRAIALEFERRSVHDNSLDHMYVDGKKNPDLIGLGYLLTSFDVNEYHRTELLARGFPEDELVLLERVGAEDFRELRVARLSHLEKRHRHVLDPFRENTAQEIAEFIFDYFGGERALYEEWSYWYLERLSLRARRVLYAYLSEVDVKYTNQLYSNWFDPFPALVGKVRWSLRSRLRTTQWAQSEHRKGYRSVKTAPIIMTDNGSSIFWYSHESLESRADGKIYFVESELRRAGLDLDTSKPVTTNKSIRFKNEKDCLPRPILPRSRLLSLNPIRERLPDMCAVFVGTIENVALGFRSDPAKLVTVRADKWLRAPTTGEEDILRIPIQGGTFTIGDTVFCKKPPTDWFDPAEGMRVVVIATRSPYHRKEGILNIDPTRVFVENEDGTPGIFSGRQADPDLKDIEDFDALIERLQGMLKEAPYRFQLRIGVDL